MEQNFKDRVGTPQQVEPIVQNGIPNAVPDANAAALQGEQPSLENFNERLNVFFGGNFDINDRLSQDLLMRHLELNREQNERLATMLDSDPRLAQLLADVVGGKRGAHSAVARSFGRGFMNIDENSPEFEEIMLADEERKDEVMRLKTGQYE